MKKLLTVIALCWLVVNSQAATTITTSTVSGHWTLAGSPYKISNNISIASGQTLIIDPGVDVVFQGFYTLTVSGTLNAIGTSAQQINFHAQDTTVGWKGITFKDSVAGSPDLSAFEYCDVYDLKTSGSFNVHDKRLLDIKSCRFFHNQSDNYLMTLGGNVSFTNSKFYNNKAHVAVVFFIMSADKKMTGCELYDNTAVLDIIRIVPTLPLTPSVVVIEQCNIYQNQSTGDGATIENWDDNNVIIRKNKIHHNTMLVEASVTLNGGTGDINGNLICNNSHLNSGFCGAAEGGGGIRLTNNSGHSDFTVRNNIIANNYSGFYGGGIFAYNANVKIVNNTIINNSVSNAPFLQGAGIDVVPIGASTYVKNNIIYNNKIAGTGALANINSGTASSVLNFENNWLQRPLSVDINGASGSILYYADTLTNIIGVAPNLVAPTLTSTPLDDATIADFRLLSTSYCINSGDSASASPYVTDYNGINRVVGTSIDIGACEFNSFCPDTISGVTEICVGSSTTLSHPVAGGTWSSAHSPLFVSVSPSGLVTGLARGVASVYYTVGGCIAGTNVKVRSLPTTILGPANVCMGSTITLVSYPKGGAWAASNSTASVSSAGIVTPAYSGIDTIFYTCSNICGTSTITTSIKVDTLPAPITGPLSVCANESATLHSSGAGIWINPEFGSTFINGVTGVYTGIIVGQWTIVYRLTATGCSVSSTVTVSAMPVINGNSGYACIGVPMFLTTDVTGGTWTSDNTAVATIDPVAGTATAASVGTANITYTTAGGCYATVILSTASCPSGVPAVGSGQQMSLFPNPAGNIISVVTPFAEGSLEIRNMVGLLVAEKQVNDVLTSLDTHLLPRGMYLIAWHHDGATTTHRMILE